MQNKFRRYLVANKPEKPAEQQQKQQSISIKYQGPNIKLGNAYQSNNKQVLFGMSKPQQRPITIQRPQSPKNVTTSQGVLLKYAHLLKDFEKEEIKKYETVYYFGQKSSKGYDPMLPNFGYDDKEGDYNPVVSDHIAYRYELLKLLGSGSFGKVYKAFDHKHKKLVALKILRNRKKFRKQGFVEIQLLERIRENDQRGENHCITLLNRGDFRNHLFLVMDMLSMDLYAYLVKFELKGLKMDVVRSFCEQLVKSLVLTQKLGIIHADIKPENILLEKESSLNVQLIDFGSGALIGQTLYQYIQSRYYRAPEVILGLPYSTEIDIWSMGCVFFELYTGYPIFQGNDEIDQLGKIAEVLGYPPKKFVDKSPRKREFFWDAGQDKFRFRTNHKAGSRNYNDMLKGAGQQFIDLITAMLQWEPEQRMKPEDIMKLPFFANAEWNKSKTQKSQNIGELKDTVLQDIENFK